MTPSKMGKKGGHARAANLSAEELSKGARDAVRARWDAYYAKNPDKLKAKQAKAKKKDAK